MFLALTDAELEWDEAAASAQLLAWYVLDVSTGGLALSRVSNSNTCCYGNGNSYPYINGNTYAYAKDHPEASTDTAATPHSSTPAHSLKIAALNARL